MEPSLTDSVSQSPPMSVPPALLECLAAPMRFGCEAALECEWQRVAPDWELESAPAEVV